MIRTTFNTTAMISDLHWLCIREAVGTIAAFPSSNEKSHLYATAQCISHQVNTARVKIYSLQSYPGTLVQVHVKAVH